jgi:hypothetical protein
MTSTKQTFSIWNLKFLHAKKNALTFTSEFSMPSHDQNKLNAITKGATLFSMHICEKQLNQNSHLQ